MAALRSVARPMLASIFLVGGAQQVADPEGHAPVAVDVTDAVRDAAVGTAPAVANASTTELVRLNGIAQVVGGLLLVLGRLPRLAALLLAGSLVPTTLAAHRYWEESDPAIRQRQQVQFYKNVSLLGGLLIATLDTEGRPSVTWRSRHAVDHARTAAEHAAEVARLRTELARGKAAHATAVDRSDHLRVRAQLAKERLTPDILDAKRLVDALRSKD